MTVFDQTASYESWLGRFTDLNESDLEYKHLRMHKRFPFFRGTYYLWAAQWPEVCSDLCDAPRVLGVGDLHVENFGAWRDPDGRLCWGVNDLDEVDELPFTSDLVRLVASARVAAQACAWSVKSRDADGAVLEGYRDTLQRGGRPFVLEERNPVLRNIVMHQELEPAQFWSQLVELLDNDPIRPPAAARRALVKNLPLGTTPQIRFRPGAGMGSLGKPRFVALVESAESWIAREVKAITPPATAWALEVADPKPPRIAKVISRATRCADPFYHPANGWIARRLGPRCRKIELGVLSSTSEALVVLYAMGAETANIHLGTPGSAESILEDLDRRPDDWLFDGARRMAEVIEQDWRAWRGRTDW
jgi:hypothetical protein